MPYLILRRCEPDSAHKRTRFCDRAEPDSAGITCGFHRLVHKRGGMGPYPGCRRKAYPFLRCLVRPCCCGVRMDGPLVRTHFCAQRGAHPCVCGRTGTVFQTSCAPWQQTSVPVSASRPRAALLSRARGAASVDGRCTPREIVPTLSRLDTRRWLSLQSHTWRPYPFLRWFYWIVSVERTRFCD